MQIKSNEFYMYENLTIRPPHSPTGSQFDRWISHSSPKWQRTAVVKMTKFLCEEKMLTRDLDDTVLSWKNANISVLPITLEAVNNNDDSFQVMIGFVRFHVHEKPVLYHCYLHPAFRMKGHFAQAWVEIIKQYDRFEIEPPVSNAMNGFLKKIDRSCILEST